MTSPPAPIHATNAWNPTGRNLQPVPGTRLFFTHADALNGPRTYVLLGNQRHLTFVADLEDHVDPASLKVQLPGTLPDALDPRSVLVAIRTPSALATPALQPATRIQLDGPLLPLYDR